MKYLQSMVIERVEPKHASPLIFMIKELAEFEKMSNQVELSEDQLADDIRRAASFVKALSSSINIPPNEFTPALFYIELELAEFEKMSNQVELSEDQLADDIRRGAIHGFIAFDNCTPLGMTLFYMAYSTWQGQVCKYC
uniref:PRD domain-containing protein n=1 Tax=Ascaris lumbricoides TaxID=6252 RepID=A0A0M3IJD2_ASCLU